MPFFVADCLLRVRDDARRGGLNFKNFSLPAARPKKKKKRKADAALQHLENVSMFECFVLRYLQKSVLFWGGGEGGLFTIATSSSELSGREKGLIHIYFVLRQLLRVFFFSRLKGGKIVTCLCLGPLAIKENTQLFATYVYMWVYASLCVAPLTVAHLKI